MRVRFILPVVALAALSCLGTACSSDAGDEDGGSSSSGAAPSTGGATGSGSTGSGSATASDGGSGAGANTSGGAASGGANGTGSTATSGGATGSGSAAASGGTGGAPPGAPGTVALSDVCAREDSTNAWGPFERNGSNGEEGENDGGPLTLGGTIYAQGFGVHAPSDLGFDLSGGCTTLTATVGIDDEMRSNGSVRFEVWGDGELLFQSEALTGSSAPLPIEVDVSGVSELRLVANDDGGNGSDHADWTNVMVECAAAPQADCAPETPAIVAPAGYHLVWSDEFDVDGAPSSVNWSFEEGFVRNEEAQWYQADNASVKAGYLIIEGRREQKPNPNYNPNATGGNAWKQTRQYAEYTSSSLHSRGKQSFQYGRFEMRARLVATQGLWPAFWTLGVAGEWPSCGEIDILEYYNSRVHANVATGTTTQWQAKWDSANRLVSSFNDDDWDRKFHVWRMDWDDQTIKLYLDDVEMNSTNLADMLNPNGESPFRQAHYILVNLAIGGPNGGDPSNTAFPTRYEVDYVRVFQKD
jgi:hypothetical protein